MLQQAESFRVVALWVRRLHVERGNEIIDVWDTRRVGVSPHYALQGSEPAEREEISCRIHPDFGKDEYVQAPLRDLLPCIAERVRKAKHMISRVVDLPRHVILRPRESEHRNIKPIAVQLFDEAARDLTDRVIVKISRRKPDLDPCTG